MYSAFSKYRYDLRRASSLVTMGSYLPLLSILYPGDMIAMRLEKSRTWYWAELDDVFRLLAKWHANRERQRKREERTRRG